MFSHYPSKYLHPFLNTSIYLYIAGADAPMPGLVTLGRDEHGLLLIDLERAGSLEISGSDSGTVLQAIAVELATTSWAEQSEVVLVGFEPDKAFRGHQAHQWRHADPDAWRKDRIRRKGRRDE